MQFEVHEKSPVLRRVEVTVSGEDVGREQSRSYATLRKQAKVPGFRPGKVPQRVLKRMYGKRVTLDTRETLIRENIKALLDELPDVLHLSPWEVTDKEMDDGGFRFEVDVEVMPAFEVGDYFGLEIEQPRVTVGDDVVEAKLEALQQEHATFEPVEDREHIEEGDFLSVDIEGEGEASALNSTDQTVELGKGDLLPGLEEALKAAKLGTAFAFDFEVPEPYPPAAGLAGQTVTLQITPRSIRRRVLPEIDDNLALDTGEAESLEELREKLRERLVKEKSQEAERAGKNNLVDALRERFAFDLPMQYVETRTIQRVEARLQMFRRQGLDIENDSPLIQRLVDDLRPMVSREVHAEFILDAIAEKEEISVTEEEVRTHIAEEATKSGMPMAQLYQIYGQPEMRRALREELLRDKVVEALLEQAEVTEVDPPPPAAAEEEEGEATAGEEDDEAVDEAGDEE